MRVLSESFDMVCLVQTGNRNTPYRLADEDVDHIKEKLKKDGE